LIADSDGREIGCASHVLDPESLPVGPDGNEICDGSEDDSDRDGVADGVETFCGTDPRRHVDAARGESG